MITPVDVLEHIIGGRTLLFFGSGPSAELNLPTWRGLVEGLIVQFGSILQKHPTNLSQVQGAVAAGNYVRAIEIVSRLVGRTELIAVCETILRDPGGTGEMYLLLASLPFAGYITTNFDDVFIRHLTTMGKTVSCHGNTRKALSEVDFDAVPSLVKIHGDLSDPEYLVLTESDYNKVQHAAHYSYIREFLKSQALSRRILIAGYSITDPDITVILAEATKILRREVPVLALVANARQEDVKHWELTYNIKVLSYPDTDGSHSALARLLRLLHDYSEGSGDPEVPTSIDMREAQRLYMWHKMSFASHEDSLHSAVDCLLLSLIAEAGATQVANSYLERVAQPFMPALFDLRAVVSASIGRLAELGFVRLRGGNLELLPAGRSQYEINSGQYSRLEGVFMEQVRVDAESDLGVGSQVAEDIAGVTRNALVDVFHERAVELFNAIFREQPGGLTLSLGLFRSLSRHARAVGDLSASNWIINYCTRVLKLPKPHEAQLLAYLARAFFCFEALKLDPGGFESRIALLSERLLLSDSNVLIPALANGHKLQSIHKDVLARIKDIGIEIVVLRSTCAEVMRAASWALQLTEAYGDSSKEVLFAARGSMGFRPNQFLQGYVETASVRLGLSFRDYLAEVFPGKLSLATVEDGITRNLGLEVVVTDDLVFLDQPYHEEKNRAIGEIEALAADTTYEKNVTRISVEAEVFAIVSKWTTLKLGRWKQSRCGFLSLAGFLGKLARHLRLGFSPVITIDGLVEVYRLAASPSKQMDFAEWISYSYFSPSLAIISNQAVRRVFAPTIGRAEDEYERHLPELRKYFGDTLSRNYIEQVPEADRPEFVMSISAKSAQLRATESLQAEVLKREIETAKKGQKKAERTARYWRQQARLRQEGSQEKRRGRRPARGKRR